VGAGKRKKKKKSPEEKENKRGAPRKRCENRSGHGKPLYQRFIKFKEKRPTKKGRGKGRERGMEEESRKGDVENEKEREPGNPKLADYFTMLLTPRNAREKRSKAASYKGDGDREARRGSLGGETSSAARKAGLGEGRKSFRRANEKEPGEGK